MEAKRIRYPIGIQTFKDIVEGDYLYIDKTGFVHDLAETYKYVFLSRPRRFGKSLLSSTFHSYFAGEKDLFEGLEAGRLKKEWTKHPVFHFDMSTAKHLSEEQLLRNLCYKLDGYEKIYSKDQSIAEDDINARFERLVKVAVEQTGEKAVIIIDEYDAPLLDVMNDGERLIPMRQIMRNFYSPIKSLDPYLRFVFITGITKFAQLSIFSELNNLKNISMMPAYSAICGISQKELDTQMNIPVQEMADELGIGFEEALGKLKSRYDGYHFCAGSEDIYNPFSLLNSLSDKMFGSYWFETATPTFLIERIRENPIAENFLDRIKEVSRNDFDISPEFSSSILPLLYQTGYLTIKGYSPEDDSFTLGYPNREVREGFINGLLNSYRGGNGMSASFVLRFNRALKDNNLDGAMELMQSFLAGIPYDLENKSEKHFQTIIYLIFSLLGYYIQAEVKSAIGRADAVCRTKDGVYVFEFKVDGSADEALRQIDDKGYLIPYKCEYAEASSGTENGQQADSDSGRKLVKVGVNISTATRTIDSWKVG
jgi:hypothetical protein